MYWTVFLKKGALVYMYIKVTYMYVLLGFAIAVGERVSGKGADLYEMCDELDAILRGNYTSRVLVHVRYVMYLLYIVS